MRQESDETWQFRGATDFSTATMTFPTAGVARDSVLSQTALSEFPIPLDSLRVWDDHTSFLPGTSANDDLGYIEGTWGTDSPTVQTKDQKSNGAVDTQYAYFEMPISHEYELGETVQIRIRSGMITTVADTTATVDLEVYSPDEDGAVGSDLCTTVAQNMNTTVDTKNNHDFTITAGGLAIGDRLLCRVAIAIEDGAGATAVIGEISRIALLKDIRG